MASLEVRENKSGTSYRVRFRHLGANCVETFTTRDRAEKWRKLVEAVGPEAALKALDVPETATARTVREQVDHYIDHLTGVTDGTRRDYRNLLQRDIAPSIGEVPLPALTRDTIAKWVNDLAGNGLSAKSIRNRHSLLSAALTAAVKDGLIREHPSKGMRMPRTDHTAQEMVFLSPAEFQLLLRHIAPKWHPLVMFLVGTGARWGEVTALTIGDLDLDATTIDPRTGLEKEAPTAHIRQSWKETRGLGYELGPPKTARSKRTVSLPLPVRDVVRPLVTGRRSTEFVFTNSRGGPVRHKAFHGDVWMPAAQAFEQATGKRPRIHDLRHTFASWAISNNQPVPVIQRALGHESVVTTIDRYGHLARSDFDALALATSQALTPVQALEDA